MGDSFGYMQNQKRNSVGVFNGVQWAPLTPTEYAALLNALTDPFAKYLLLAGRAGGQTAIGGTATGEKLILQANSFGGSDAEVEILSTATGATGPWLSLYHNSASPAVSDLVGFIRSSAKDANGTKSTVGQIVWTLTETTAGAISSTLGLFAAHDGTQYEIRLAPDANTMFPVIDNHWDLGIAASNRFRSLYLSNAIEAAGTINSTVGFTANSVAPAGNVLRGDGTRFVSSTLAGTDVVAAYTGYTPTITQGGTVTSFTTNTARYSQIGKHVHVEGLLTINNAGTAAGANEIIISLPVTAAASASPVAAGAGTLYDTSADILYPFMSRITSTTAFKMVPTDQIMLTYAAGGLFMGTLRFTAALATGDQIVFNFSYEAA